MAKWKTINRINPYWEEVLKYYDYYPQYGGLCEFELFKSTGTNIIWFKLYEERRNEIGIPRKDSSSISSLLSNLLESVPPRGMDLFGAQSESVRWLCHTPGAALNATQLCHHHQHHSRCSERKDGRTTTRKYEYDPRFHYNCLYSPRQNQTTIPTPLHRLRL